jgi:hypothetical protein
VAFFESAKIRSGCVLTRMREVIGSTRLETNPPPVALDEQFPRGATVFGAEGRLAGQ